MSRVFLYGLKTNNMGIRNMSKEAGFLSFVLPSQRRQAVMTGALSKHIFGGRRAGAVEY